MKLPLHLLLLFCSITSIGQVKFKPGYFIEEGGTKITCLIKYEAWNNNPADFEYKLPDNDAVKKASVTSVAEFGIDGEEKFKRFAVKIDRSATGLDRMSSSKEPLWSDEVLFLNVLAEGKANLYQYEQGEVKKFFFSIEPHTVAEQLIYKEYVSDGKIRENNAFRQQLYNLTSTNASDRDGYKNVGYTKRELVSIFHNFNGDSGSVSKEKSNKKGTFNIKVTPGLTLTSLNVENISNNAISYDFGRKTGFRIGLELEYVLPVYNNQLALFVDPNFQNYSDSGTNSSGFGWEVTHQFIELPIGARHYFYVSDASKFFVNLSYSMTFNLKESYIRYNDNYKMEISNTYRIGLGAGYAYNRLSIEGRYTFKHILSESTAFTSDSSVIAFILGYKIL
ncbi:MAG: hypothetical protein EOO45_07545 [Flavobacterium sp.]|nr:MAG: hypothetical protein EOO45_07545 [Flavobacterium sp.]